MGKRITTPMTRRAGARNRMAVKVDEALRRQRLVLSLFSLEACIT
jgi:hypothetical protein